MEAIIILFVYLIGLAVTLLILHWIIRSAVRSALDDHAHRQQIADVKAQHAEPTPEVDQATLIEQWESRGALTRMWDWIDGAKAPEGLAR